MNNKKFFISIIFSLLGFSVFAVLIKTGYIKGFDSFVYNHIAKLISDNITIAAKSATFMGTTVTYIGIIIFTFVIGIKYRRWLTYASVLSINLLLCWLANEGLKRIFVRPRPNIHRIVKVGGYSFPSGHSMVSFCFYGFVLYIIIANSRNGITKLVFSILIPLLILSIGLSRIYLGVHYTSDVLSGFLGGLFCLSIFIKLEDKYVRPKMFFI
jgi:undecaprenyl-diphosphatase